MLSAEQVSLQNQIRTELSVDEHFDVDAQISRRAGFLADYLKRHHIASLVLGISGGVDSLVAGCLCQRAVETLRAQGGAARFYAMRLPYGEQKDESEAQASLNVIKPDEVVTVNIKAASDSMLQAVKAGGTGFRDAFHEDFVLGNIKARQRMIAQYAVAGAYGGVVVGTDHAAEALMGFFTKFGDGAADLTPLTGLSKRRVRALAHALGAPDDLVYKVPTADLESLAPQKPDEHAFGLTYDQLDDFLEGKVVEPDVFERIVDIFRRTAHKRALPYSPS
ncbi:MAG: NAD(+) synthase [Pusillimonas sp.]|nr:NAD(+) synthase [Pusillimonas sp.]|tara:strand:- start:19565 stop:20398 length:834 start_codon:yes stop_codon:yes gene_type:complete